MTSACASSQAFSAAKPTASVASCSALVIACQARHFGLVLFEVKTAR